FRSRGFVWGELCDQARQEVFGGSIASRGSPRCEIIDVVCASFRPASPERSSLISVPSRVAIRGNFLKKNGSCRAARRGTAGTFRTTRATGKAERRDLSAWVHRAARRVQGANRPRSVRWGILRSRRHCVAPRRNLRESPPEAGFAGP